MEVDEVELKKIDDVMFKRIGVDVPMLLDGQGFSSDQLPTRALAVSNRFGYCLYAHSRGVSIAKTADLIEIAENLKDKSKAPQTAQAKSIATIPGNDIRSLSLSSDERTVAVCFGESVKFYDLPALVRKSDTCPFEVRRVDPVADTHAKEFSWSPTDTDAYLIVTENQKLLLGRVGSASEVKVEKGVLTASWSEDGQHVAYVSENRQLSITTSTFAKSFDLELPAHLSEDDVESDLNVDAIRWVRPDSIMVGYVRVNSEGEEDGYPLFLVTSTSGNLAEEQSRSRGLVFYQLFPSVDSFVAPSGSGPYMLVDYLKPWEIVVTASRKSVDDHIVLLGWLPENGKEEAYSLELGNDLWLPRIELQDNGDDNALVGLAIDRTTVQIQLTDPKDDAGETKLPPCPVLICATLEGKLSFFSFARVDDKRHVPNLVSAPSDIPESKSGKASRATGAPASKPLDESERRSVAKQADLQEKRVEEISSQPAGFSSMSKDDGKDNTASLQERLSRPSPSLQSGLSQKAEGPKLGLQPEPSQSSPFTKTEGSKLGFISGSQDSRQSSLNAGSALALRDKGVENMASPHQGLFRPFEDGPRGGSLSMNTNFPPSFSFNESTRASSLTKTVPLQITVSSSALGTSSQAMGVFLNGDEKASATRPVSLQPERASQVPATTAFSLSSALPGKGFQAGATGFPNGAAAFSGKANDTGLVTRPPGLSSQGMKGSQVSNSSQRVTLTQRVDKVNPGLQSWSGQDQQSQGRATGVSDMEAAFITELEKVRRMAEEVDQLMYYIEGRVTTNDLEINSTFTRRSLEELEQGIHDLSEDCKSNRRQLTQEKQNIEDLRDESLRVDAWRIYARSLMEQKNDSRHQELWTLQKLHPELDMKRKRVLKADQDLKMKIAEMEKHLHSLELQQWQADHARRRPNKQVRTPGQFLSVQNVYSTVNVQMAAAEELSLSLAQQMEALNIDWSSPNSRNSTAAVILKSVGAQPEDVIHPNVESNGQSPISRQRLSYSPVPRGAASVNRITTPGGQGPDLCVSSQETTRRRRDSMDPTWVESGAPKTTINRPVHNKPNQGFASGSSSLPTFMQGKGTAPDVSARESWSQPRDVRQTQSMRMATQSTNVNFSSPRFEAAVSAPSGRTATSGPQWPFAQQDQQKRSSSTPQNGDPAAAHSALFGSSSVVGNVDAKESISKWGNSATGSKISPVAPAYPLVAFGKQGTVGSSGDSSFALRGKMTSTATSRQSAGSIDWAAGSVGGNFPSVPATKPRLEGAFDGGAGDMMGRTVGPMKGIMLGNNFGSVSSTDNHMDGRLGKETNQNQRGSSSGGSAPLVTGSFLTGPEPTFPTPLSPLFLTGSTSGSGATASHSELLQLAERSVGSKQQESDGRTDRGNESEASLKQSSVADFPAQSRPSISEIQRSGVLASMQKEPANQSDDIKVATNSRNATFGSGAKSFFDFSSKPSLSPATVCSTSGFTSVAALASGTSSQSQVSRSLFSTGANVPGELSSGIRSSTSSPVSKGSGSASPVSAAGPGAMSQSASLPSSAVDKSDLTAVAQNIAPPFSSPAVTAAPKLGIQGNTSTTPNMFLVPSADTRLMSGNAGASAGGQAPTISSISSDLGKSFLTSASSTSAPIQSDGSPFTSSSVPTTAQSALSPFTLPSVSPPSQTTTSPFASSSISSFSSAGIQMTSSPFGQSGTWPSSGQLPFMFPNSSSMPSTVSVTPSALDNNEDDMEEEAITAASTATLGGFGGFGGLGIGSSNTPAQTQKTNPFGGSLFGSSPAPTLSAPSGGQLFRPAAFSLPATQSSSPQPSGGGPFGSGFGSSGFSQNNLFSSTDAGKHFGSPSQSSPGGFGQPAQLGPGQQALGSALGAFGQTRQVGFGTPSLTAASGGFASAPQGGGFANAATGGGFSSAATGGGFASAATGGGFAAAATGGGFAAAATGGGFAGAATGGGFADIGAGGGFQAFGGTQASQPFGGGVQASLFTQMRK